MTLVILSEAVHSDNVRGKVSYIITPSLNVSCPENESCFTLSEFADSHIVNSSGHETNISLVFMPGSHNLQKELSFSHANSLTITNVQESNDSVTIECHNETGRFIICNTTFVLIGSLHFIGCGHNTVTQVEELVIFDTTFQGVDGRGRALLLNAVTAASIIESSFISNNNTLNDDVHYIQDGVECVTLDRNESLSAGGALCIVSSNVTVINSTFAQNTAETGGALVAYLSNLHIAQSAYILNRAEVGGAIVTSQSTVNIDNSIFAANTADMYGGVMVSHRDSFLIGNTIFIYNDAGIGGVMQIDKSMFKIADSTFRDNTAYNCCGVAVSINSSFSVNRTSFTSNSASTGGVITVHETSCEIASSTFDDNSAAYNGGVMISDDKSLINIVDCSFNHNRAELYNGGVFFMPDSSSFHIKNCIFFNNSAYLEGGVMYVLNDLSVAIIDSIFYSNSASQGGVIAIFQTSNVNVTIITSTFSHNRAERHGGVLLTRGRSLFNISSCLFNSNRAESLGGVMYTLNDSELKVMDCTFVNNHALDGGVIYAVEASSYHVIHSNFVTNSAQYGGVLDAFGNSFFKITNCTFNENRAIEYGGVMCTFDKSLFNISSCIFDGNVAESQGGVMYTLRESELKIMDCTFANNYAVLDGGVIYAVEASSFHVVHTNFVTNSAQYGGVLDAFGNSFFEITNCTFNDNRAIEYGGVMCTLNKSSINISSCVFDGNVAENQGGVMFTFSNSELIITDCTFVNNYADLDGGIIYAVEAASHHIVSTNFTTNAVGYGGGVIAAFNFASFNIASSTFSNNSAEEYGGVMYTFGAPSFQLRDCSFVGNYALVRGGAIFNVEESSFHIISSNFIVNCAGGNGGAIYCEGKSLILENSLFEFNYANTGLVFASECPTYILNSTFIDNYGSLYPFNTNLTLGGYIRFENAFGEEGRAITAFQSTVINTGVTHFISNRASQGGAILATDSTITLYGESVISNNVATNGEGGGISLRRSVLEIKGRCDISHNYATRGGGIHGSSSTVSIHQPGMLQLFDNSAENGSGMFLEVNTKLYLLKYPGHNSSQTLLLFDDNHADYGGAMYVRDDTNSGACSPNVECFVQTIALYSFYHDMIDTVNMKFNGNTATEQGPDLFGGLLDRCIPNPFSEVYIKYGQYPYGGLTYIRDISDVEREFITSLAVRICICNNKREPDCSYHPTPVHVRKGETFNVLLVAVDQVNHTVDAHIISSLSSSEGGFGEGQQIQKVGRNCTDLTFNVYSPHESETINLSADGPCGSSTLSTTKLNVQFLECTCPVGFEPLSATKSTRCECVCDSALSPYITNCSYQTRSLIRLNTNSWISYTNTTSPAGYVVHSNCPFDYCRPPTENVSMDLNLPDGADAQCAYNRRGVLCGACQQNYSLSLGTSSCLPCPTHWPVFFVIVTITALIAGILLVVAVLALNLTVAVGLVNSFIFYANIVAAGNSVFFPSLQPSFPNVFVAWLNLDIGIDVCFIDGLDAYTKVWLQLIFPAYIISLVILVIIVSEFSPRFSTMIGKRDPIATLATLFLLSYAKLLSVTITALSFGNLDYPDGSQEVVWLPDGDVKYFQGKHIPLFLVAMLIITIALPYTFLLFLWQWIVRAPRWKLFKWTRNTKLNAFVSTYHVPYNKKYRYWTGLLLLVRVVLYITASATNASNPQTFLLMAIVLISGLVVLSKGVGVRVYKNTFVDIVDTIMYLNLLTFSAFSLYDFKADTTKQTAVAYTSTIVTFFLLLGANIYHVILVLKKDKHSNEQTTEAVHTSKAEVTHSEVEFHDHQYSQAEGNDTEPCTEIKELSL